MLVREQFRSGIWRVLKWTAVSIVLISGLLAVLLAAAGDLRSVSRLAPLDIILALLIFNFGRLTGWIRTQEVERTDPNVAHPMTYTLDEQGIGISMRTASSDLKWSGLFKVRETQDLILFYYSKRLAYYLPKRVIASDAELNELRRWIRDQLPPDVPFLAHSTA